MPTPPAAVVDALVSLQDAEQSSIFRFMDESSPYLSRATADVRAPLQGMVRDSFRHCEELAGVIRRLGGSPRPPGTQTDDPLLAHLSFKFLLPKLVEAKQFAIRRYENTLKAIKDGPADVVGLVRAQLAEHRADLAALEKAAERSVGK